MQFSNFTRVEEGNVIKFYTPNPLKGVTDIKYYSDNATGSFQKKEFRWSFNSDYWSSWETLNQGNLSSVDIGTNTYLFLEIRYTASTTGKVTSFVINYDGAAQTAYTGQSCPPDSTYVAPDQTVRDTYTPGTAPGTTSSTNALTLCGKACDYYLWRPNQKGTQPISTVTDLQRILNELAAAVSNVDVAGAANVDEPGIGVYYDTENKIIRFKTIVGENRIEISENLDGQITIEFDGDAITDGSLGPGFAWGPGGVLYVDASASGVNKLYVDGSLAARDASINKLFVDQFNLFNYIDGSLASRDASINLLFQQNQWSDRDPISAEVGGIHSGDILDGSTSIQILEKMLYEYFPPRVNININPSSGYYEKWDPFVSTATIYGTFDNQDFTKVRVTDISAYVSIEGGLLQPINMAPTHISYPDSSDGSFSFSDGSFSNWEDVIYYIKTYNNVNGIPMPTLDSSIALKFVNPYYAGIVDNSINKDNISEVDILSLEKFILPKQTQEIDFDVSANYSRIKFVYAYPYEYGNLKSIFDVKNDFNVTTSFDDTSVNITSTSSPTPIAYKVYIKNHWISFTPDVSIFKLIFNI